MRSVPADGTFLVALDDSGAAYHMAGGAPLRLSSWAPFGTQPYVGVNKTTIDSLDHMRAVPADGTFLVALENGHAYHVAGGAPLYLSSWAPWGGVQPYAGVNQTTVDTLDHMRAVPADGTILQGLPSATFWVIQAGRRQAAAGTQPSSVIVNDNTIYQFDTTTPATCPCSLWTNATPQASTVDGGVPVELGVKIRSDVAGYIRSVRFYKPASETGTHVVNLWSGTGTLLGTAASNGETASGWQQANFTTAVSIAANTTYVASYHSNGSFVHDLNAFDSAGVNSQPLHAVRTGVDGPNSVYLYGPGSAFPTDTYQASNYWVDVVYAATAQASCPCSVWTSAAQPANATTGGTVELGVKIRSGVVGSITDVRFYKPVGETGLTQSTCGVPPAP